MQRPLHLALPRQGVDELMKLHGHLEIRQRLALVVEQLQVRDEAQRIGHRDDPLLQLDPVPGDAGGLGFSIVAPEGLAGARLIVIAKVQHASTEVREEELGRAARLPQ